MILSPLAWMPRSVMSIAREMARHVLRHPVVGVAAAAHTGDDRWLLVRRADTGTWCMPGGTLEWGETLRSALVREVAEESGARVLRVGRVTGIYSRPDRDTRFHGVVVVARVLVDAAALQPANPLEIREARLFRPDGIPAELAFEGTDMLRDAMEQGEVVLE
jgi:8-oxo-dGTP diphosphatase